MAERVRARAPEIRREILDRLYGMEEEAPTRDAEYQRGLREAVSSGVDYGIALLEVGLERAPQVPIALVVQSRLAARQGIPLEMVVRRYLAAKTRLGDVVLEEAAAGGISNPALLRAALAAHETAFDRLLATIAEEFKREEESRHRSPEFQLAEQVRRLLAAELVDPSCLDYNLTSHHLGLVVGSPKARQIVRSLAADFDSRPLIVRVTDVETWAWLGSKGPLDAEAVGRRASRSCSPSVPIALGEPAGGRSGWRLTHRQARAAFSAANVSKGGYARYAEVALAVGAAASPTLSASLQELYLAPLQKGREGAKLRATLRAYFCADRNVSSAAAALKVSRQTVTSRLRHVESQVGQPLNKCGDAIAAALHMEELGLLVEPRDPTG